MPSETESDPPPAPREKTLAALASEIAGESAQLLHDHLHLLDTELHEQLRQLKRAAEWTGTGLVALTIGALFVMFGLVRLLQDMVSLPESAAWLIVGSCSLLGGFALYRIGRNRMARANLFPSRTLTSLDACWKSMLAKFKKL